MCGEDVIWNGNMYNNVVFGSFLKISAREVGRLSVKILARIRIGYLSDKALVGR